MVVTALSRLWEHKQKKAATKDVPRARGKPAEAMAREKTPPYANRGVVRAKTFLSIYPIYIP